VLRGLDRYVRSHPRDERFRLRGADPTGPWPDDLGRDGQAGLRLVRPGAWSRVFERPVGSGAQGASAPGGISRSSCASGFIKVAGKRTTVRWKKTTCKPANNRSWTRTPAV